MAPPFSQIVQHYWRRWSMTLGAVVFAVAFAFLTPDPEDQSEDFKAGMWSGLAFAASVYCISRLRPWS